MKNNHGMTISEVFHEGIPSVLDVQDELAIAPRMFQRNETLARSGLLISGHSYADIIDYFNAGGRIFGSFDASGAMTGYVLMAPGAVFVKQYGKASIQWQNVDLRRRWDGFLRAGRYLYVVQIGVRWDYHKRGVSDALMDRVEAAHPKLPLIALIMTRPIDNRRSQNFFARLGYETMCNIYVPRLGMIDGFEGVLMHKKSRN